MQAHKGGANLYVITTNRDDAIANPLTAGFRSDMTQQRFSILCPTQVQFGPGCAQAHVAAMAGLGTHVLLIHGANPQRAKWLIEALGGHDLALTTVSCPREPDVDLIHACVDRGRTAGVDFVIGLGGGAVIDTAKAVAGLIPAQGQVIDYLEVVGRGQPLDANPIPWVAIPTTAGTGAEVTRNAVIDVPTAQRKVSLRDDRLLPHMAIVDSTLTAQTPRHIVLASGLDAITQVIEPYISAQATRFTDALCRDAIAPGLAALRQLLSDEPADAAVMDAARDDMAWVSLSGGLALANAKLGAVHGLAGPLGGLINAPHGAIAGCLLPEVLAANQSNAQDQPETAARIDEVKGWIAQALGVDRGEAWAELAAWSRHHGLPGLEAMGLKAADRQRIAQAALGSSSMQGNPVALSVDTLIGVLENAA